jgi:hypothetical protein
MTIQIQTGGKVLDEVRIVGEHETACGALRAAGQQPHIGKLLQHPKCMIDSSRVGSRLDVETDGGGADDQKNGEAYSENDTLRRHRRYFHFET